MGKVGRPSKPATEHCKRITLTISPETYQMMTELQTKCHINISSLVDELIRYEHEKAIMSGKLATDAVELPHIDFDDAIHHYISERELDMDDLKHEPLQENNHDDRDEDGVYEDIPVTFDECEFLRQDNIDLRVRYRQQIEDLKMVLNAYGETEQLNNQLQMDKQALLASNDRLQAENIKLQADSENLWKHVAEMCTLEAITDKMVKLLEEIKQTHTMAKQNDEKLQKR